MKETLLRVVGSLCIIAAVLLMFLPDIVAVKGVSRKDLREYRKFIVTDLENI